MRRRKLEAVEECQFASDANKSEVHEAATCTDVPEE
jgi:hypothetical protein